MLASVSRWRINESVREDAAFLNLLQTSLRPHVAMLRELGVLDIMVVRIAEDVLLAVTVYENDAEGNEGWAASQIAFRDDLLGKLELISRVAGPAFDLPQLLNDAPPNRA